MSDWHRPYEGYLFDLDGTLVDTAPDINVALNRSLEQSGLLPVTEAHTRHWIGHGGRVLLKEALLHQQYPGDIDAKLDILLPDFLDYYGAHHAELSRPYPGVVETLKTLQTQGAKLAVVTNKITRLSLPILDTLALTPFFDSIVCGDTTAQPKPDAAPVHFCLDQLKLAKADVLFVGDSSTDASAARAADVAVVLVRDGYNHGEDVHAMGVDGVIDRFEELL